MKKASKPMPLVTLKLSAEEAMVVSDLLNVHMEEARQLFEDNPTEEHHTFVIKAESLYQRIGDATFYAK